MRAPQKMFFRFGALFSVVLLSQCCCCIIPLPAQAEQSLPFISPMIDSIETLLLLQPWAVELSANFLAEPAAAFFLP